MIDASLFKTRSQLLHAFPVGLAWAEVGVDRATFSKEILAIAKPRLLVLVDNWKHEIAAGLDNPNDPNPDINCCQEEKEVRCKVVRESFASDRRVLIIRDYSVPAAMKIGDASLDVVYIDANHQMAYDDAVAWWLKLASGGYLCGHDYVDGSRFEPVEFITVKPDIDRFAAERGLVVSATNERYASWVIQKP